MGYKQTRCSCHGHPSRQQLPSSGPPLVLNGIRHGIPLTWHNSGVYERGRASSCDGWRAAALPRGGNFVVLLRTRLPSRFVRGGLRLPWLSDGWLVTSCPRSVWGFPTGPDALRFSILGSRSKPGRRYPGRLITTLCGAPNPCRYQTRSMRRPGASADAAARTKTGFLRTNGLGQGRQLEFMGSLELTNGALQGWTPPG